MATIEPNTLNGDSIGVRPSLLVIEKEVEVSVENEEEIEAAGPGEIIEEHSVGMREERKMAKMEDGVVVDVKDETTMKPAGVTNPQTELNFQQSSRAAEYLQILSTKACRRAIFNRAARSARLRRRRAQPWCALASRRRRPSRTSTRPCSPCRKSSTVTHRHCRAPRHRAHD